MFKSFGSDDGNSVCSNVGRNEGEVVGFSIHYKSDQDDGFSYSVDCSNPVILQILLDLHEVTETYYVERDISEKDALLADLARHIQTYYDPRSDDRTRIGAVGVILCHVYDLLHWEAIPNDENNGFNFLRIYTDMPPLLR
jgi:hypothetical protein